MPAEFQPAAARPGMGNRSHTELGDSPRTTQPPLSRSQTVEPDMMSRPTLSTKSAAALPPIGLPATPRAMRHPKERDDAPPLPGIPLAFSELSSGGSITGSALSQVTGSNLSQLSSLPRDASSITQPSLVSQQSDLSKLTNEGDDIGPLLPSSVFGQKPAAPPPRSASVPLESSNASVHPAYKPTLPSTRRLSAARHIRKISPPDSQLPTVTPVSIDEAISNNDQQIVVLNEDGSTEVVDPPILPELQHLAGPPPPPPPPTMFQTGSAVGSDVISIAMDGSSASELSSTLPSTVYPTSSAPHYPMPMERATTASPTAHRRGRGSVSETFGSRFKGYTDRMRSQSRSRAKSPPMGAGGSQQNIPYETVLPPMPGPHSRSGSVNMNRAKSPYELAMTAGGQDEPMPPPPPPIPGTGSKLSETSIPPSTLPSSRAGSTTGYRNPKEIRANMPPETLQQGVYNGGFL
jgi:hypothetical protein